MRALWCGAVLLAMVPALASADSTPSTPTIQQSFDNAAALYDSGKVAEALAAWELLEPRVAGKPRSLAIVRLRKGLALYALGRRDEAVAATRAALADLPASDASLRNDRLQGYTLLAKTAEASLDYAAAAENYRAAEALSDSPLEHLGSLRGLIETETFTNSDAAVADLARAAQWLGDKSVENVARASLKRVESQLLLNRGDFAGAQAAAGEGVKLLGGLTSKTDLNDVAARSNYAIASMLLGQRDKAREYMAYTGAGRVPTGEFDPAVQMTPPDCGGDLDLKPEDTAVVEFSIGDDGSIVYATPVYASRGGEVALQFARAVRNWSWKPEQVKALPPFFRYRARVELRCSTEFPKPSLTDYLDRSLADWLAERKVVMPPASTGADAASLAGQRKALADIEAAKGPDALALVPALDLLSRNSVVPRAESGKLAQREFAILSANKAPARALLATDLRSHNGERSDSWLDRAAVKRFETMAASSPYASDPQTRAVLRLMAADAARGDKERARALLDQVANDSALDAQDTLRVGALIRIAAIYAQQGNAAAAKAAYDRTGTSEAQCSLADSKPRLLGLSANFPSEAKAWGFEGWTSVQFDISADGKVLTPRVVISYPPYIFSQSATDGMKTARYAKTYRPDGGPGCDGTTARIKFVLGH